MAFWIWIIMALLLLALELVAPGFICTSLAVGCIPAAIASLLGLPLIFQLIFCIIGLVIGFLLIRPLLQRRKDEEPTNAERMIGMEVIITEAIPHGGRGYVKLEGTEWPAVSGKALEPGRKAIVKALKGNTLVVEEE